MLPPKRPTCSPPLAQSRLFLAPNCSVEPLLAQAFSTPAAGTVGAGSRFWIWDVRKARENLVIFNPPSQERKEQGRQALTSKHLGSPIFSLAHWLQTQPAERRGVGFPKIYPKIFRASVARCQGRGR